jgi:hypothetical protein
LKVETALHACAQSSFFILASLAFKEEALFLSKSIAARGRTMEDSNRPDATLILEDVIMPVLPFLPPGDIWNLRGASRRVKEAILDGSRDMFILGERRVPTMMGVGHYWDDVDDMDEDEEDDGGQRQHTLRVYQIQKFRFALSVRRSDLVDEECKLTISMIVVEVVLHNGV